jgi:hypothetical protein
MECNIFKELSREYALCDCEMQSVLGLTLRNRGVMLVFHFLDVIPGASLNSNIYCREISATRLGLFELHEH